MLGKTSEDDNLVDLEEYQEWEVLREIFLLFLRVGQRYFFPLKASVGLFGAFKGGLFLLGHGLGKVLDLGST